MKNDFYTKKNIKQTPLWGILFVVLLLITSITNNQVLAADSPLQEILIKGTVKDAHGEPLIGVIIQIKGETGGTVTDIDGKFSINAPGRNSVLVVSYMGFKSQEITIGDRTIFDIVLSEDAKHLEEVVVVGYGVQKKGSVTSAISTVNVADLKVAAPRSINNILAGKVSGIVSVQRSGEPGKDDAQFWIRGISTHGAGNEPLVLVDGVERSLSNVEPEDIENFSVLKDASATSIYGIKGANGVILVTTRRGKTGAASINFKFETGMQQPIAKPQFVDAPTYLELLNEANLASNPNYVTPYTPEVIEKHRSGEDPWLYPNVDWMKLMMKDHASSQRFTVNATGGTEKARYYIAGSYYGETGIWNYDKSKSYDSETRLRRVNFRSNTDLMLTKRLELSLGLGGYLMLGNSPGEDNSGNLWYHTMLARPAKYAPTAPNPEDPRETAYLGSGGAGDFNPYALLVNSGYTDKWANTLQTDVNLKFDASDVLKGLKAGMMFSYDAYSYNNVKRNKSDDAWVVKGRDANGELILEKTYSGSKELGYTKSAGGNRRVYFQSNLNYDQTFNEDHGVSGLILFNMQDYQDGDAASSIMGLPYRTTGLVGRATYNYKNRYFIEANVAYNGSENFKSGDRFGLFPSISLGWIISDESFFQNMISDKIINYLKFRGSYGVKGNDRVGGRRFAYLTTTGGGYGSYILGKDVNNNWYSIGEDEWGADLTWEKEAETNLGIEVRFLDGFYIQADFFKRHRENIFQARNSMPAIIGVAKRPYANIGEFENKGIDATFEYNRIIGDLQVSFKANYTFARNNLLNNDEPDYKYTYQNRKGKRLNQPFGLVAEGLFTSQEDIASSPTQTFGAVRVGDIKYKDINGDGVVDTYDEVAIGNPDIPETVYGFGVSLGYKGFDASIFFQGAANMDFMLGGDGFFPFTRGETQGNVTKWATDRWTEENPRQDALFPRLSSGDNPNNYRNSTWWQRSANYLRIKTAEVGYTFPKTMTKKVGVSAFRIYVSGLNLHTFSSFKYWDPELGNGSGAAYPLSRTLTAGINVNF
ncbi:SusC/RagA family TonB-linked outer membrane protein [Dysgonomonas reticulitermitis]